MFEHRQRRRCQSATAVAAAALFLLLLHCGCSSYASAEELTDRLRDDPETTQATAKTLRRIMPVRFYSLLEQDAVANSTVSLRSCTIFVPTNEAFQRHHGPTHVLYHITTSALNRDQLPSVVTTDMTGSPSLFITKNRNGDIYVNNARIISSLSVEITNRLGNRQVMHVIDEVLEPLTPLPTTKDEINNPDALLFLNKANQLNIGSGNAVRTYRSQVIAMRKEDIYSAPGTHTFFIPIDEGFKRSTRSSLVDAKVIDAHVVPNVVLFTAPTANNDSQATLAFEDLLKVNVAFDKHRDGKIFVKSVTKIGDGKHQSGAVLAEVVKANIPVRNGVVHLIHKPLVIVDSTVGQYFQESQNSAVRKFFEVIMDNGGNVLDEVNNLAEVTILAPSNEAWNSSSINNVLRDRNKMRDIINMHVIRDRLNVDKIRQISAHGMAHVPTVNNRTFLYFNVRGEGADTVVSVEGGGVNATVEQANIAQTNGYVHIIDHVLGIPYSTVLGKVESDPMMSDTFKIGTFSNFNEQLNNTQRRYTFFVPRNKAWEKSGIDYPSAHKKLFMRDFAYHSRAILERHLVIADKVFTISDLVRMSHGTDSIVLPTYRDSLKLKVEEIGAQYKILWNLKTINVVRPDVECTNGIIHVIDTPLLEEKDIVVSGGSYLSESSICIMLASLIMLTVAKFLN